MAFIGAGALLGANETGSNVDFTGVREINLPEFSANSPETTHLASTGGVRTYRAGTRENGMLSFRQLYSEADYLRFLNLFNVEYTWKVVDSQSSSNVVWSMPGILNKITNPKFVQDGDAVVVEISGEVKISGVVTITN